MRLTNTGIARILAIVAASLAAFFTPHPTFAETYTESVLFGFCNQCSNGYEPRSALYEEPSGDLFGTTFGGGHANGGTIFQMHYDAISNTYTHLLLHEFCSKKDCTDGGGTVSGLLPDESGNLYGTTVVGGAHGKGTVYELIFDQTKQNWTYKVLYNFCSAGGACTDGATPHAGLIADQSGNLYGTTHDGGAHNFGSIYELFFDQTKQKWVEQVLYSFNCSGTDSCPQGGTPDLGLFFDEDGNLFGTTPLGAHFGGNVFELIFNQTKQKWVYSDIYDFCAQTGCPDGGAPSGRFVQDFTGTLYSTTAVGGVHDQGAVYTLSPSKKGWKESVLYSFCVSANCPDGQSPSGTLYFDASNDLIGTTGAGGANKSGTVYQLTNEGAKKGWVHTILYSFCGLQNCADGSIPTSGIVSDKSGKFFGTTEGGGVFGTVFELTPPPR